MTTDSTPWVFPGILKEDGRILLHVKVTPGAKRDLVRGLRWWQDERGQTIPVVLISVKDPARDHLANRACERIIAAFMGVSSSQASIVKGERERLKLVQIQGIERKEIEARLKLLRWEGDTTSASETGRLY